LFACSLFETAMSLRSEPYRKVCGNFGRWRWCRRLRSNNSIRETGDAGSSACDCGQIPHIKIILKVGTVLRFGFAHLLFGLVVVINPVRPVGRLLAHVATVVVVSDCLACCFSPADPPPGGWPFNLCTCECRLLAQSGGGDRTKHFRFRVKPTSRLRCGMSAQSLTPFSSLL
jgi:hypothetical protein